MNAENNANKIIEHGCLVERGLRPQSTRAMIKPKKQINFFFFKDHRIEHSPLACFDSALSVHNTERGSCLPLLYENMF